MIRAGRSCTYSRSAAGAPGPAWQVLLPIHNGTFDLALHAWQQPFERITALAAAKRVPVATR